MTCKDCGMTIGWDCECDPEYNALVAEAERRADARLLDMHQRFYGAQPEDALLLEAPLPPHHEDHT